MVKRLLQLKLMVLTLFFVGMVVAPYARKRWASAFTHSKISRLSEKMRLFGHGFVKIFSRSKSA